MDVLLEFLSALHVFNHLAFDKLLHLWILLILEREIEVIQRVLVELQ